MPVAIGPVVALALFALVALLIGLSYAYRYTFGALILWLADKFRAVSVPLPFTRALRPLAFIADAIGALDNSIRHAFGVAIAACQSGWHSVLYANSLAWQWIGREIGDLATDTGKAVQSLVTVTIPNVGTSSYRRVIAQLATVAATVAALKHAAVARVEKVTPVIEHKVTTVGHTVTKAVAGVLPLPLPNIHELEREADSLGKRITNLSKRFSPALVVGLIGATIFKQFDLGWLRCRGVNKVGRSLCGLSGLIESLFADALDVLLVANLCEITTLMSKGAHAIEPEIAYLVSLTDGLAKCQGTSAAAPLPVKWYRPPAAQAYAAL